MLRLKIFLVLTIFGNVFSSQTTITEDRGILVLTNENFYKCVQENRFMLVEFYAPWCGYCQAFAPVFVQTAELLKRSGSPARLGKVDATQEMDLAWAHDIKGYPTLVYFSSGSPTLYNGNRRAMDIVDWLNRNIQ